MIMKNTNLREKVCKGDDCIVRFVECLIIKIS